MSLVNKIIKLKGFSDDPKLTNISEIWVSGDDAEINRITQSISHKIENISTLELGDGKILTFEEGVKWGVDYDLPKHEEAFLKRVDINLATEQTPSIDNFLPESMLLDVDFVPMDHDNAIYMDYPLTQPDFPVLRNSVENNNIKLFNAKKLPSNSLGEANFIPWLYLYRSNISFMVQKESLPAGHWALDYIMDLDDEEFIIQTYNQRSPTSTTPSFFKKYDVNLCDYYTITHKCEHLLIDNIAVAHSENKNGKLLFPMNVGAGDDQILRQVKTYEVNLSHGRHSYNVDKKRLLKWVQTTKKRRAFSIVK
jgi:hypothetical protein